MRTINKLFKAICLMITLAIFIVSTPLTVTAATTRLYDDDGYYEDEEFDYTYPGLSDAMEEMNEYFEWYEILPYSEQMRILKADWEIQEQMRRDQEASAKAKVAAEAAKPITLKVNGRVIKTDSPPVIQNGYTLAPLRAVVEALGHSSAWESSTQTMGVYSHDTDSLVVSMKIGSNIAQVAIGSRDSYIFDDRILETPSKLINGRVMVPVRFIAETLGCTVKWDQKTKIINITQAQG